MKVFRYIDESRLYYGDEEEQSINYQKKAKSMAVCDRSIITANSVRSILCYSKSLTKELSNRRKSYIMQKASGQSEDDSLSFSKEVVKIMTKQAKEK